MANLTNTHASQTLGLHDLKTIPNDPVPRDEAIYLASLSPGFCEDIQNNQPARALPAGLTMADLNPLNPSSSLFYSPYMMSSAGQALNSGKACIIKNRDRASSLILADSGGYQVASGKLVIRSDADRLAILRWQEAVGDVCLTLDSPTRQPEHRIVTKAKTQEQCLAETLDHLRFYQQNRANPDTYWLNVLQGNDTAFADTWYEQVKGFGFESFAFAGPLRDDFYHVVRRLLQMMDEQRLENLKWLHVLGTSKVETALMLSAIQRSINQHVAPGLRLSFDTGSPSRLLNWNSIYTALSINGGKMVIKTEKAPEGPEFLGSAEPWPWPSALGRHLTMGDVTTRPSVMTGTYRDTLANHYLIHMNLTTLCDGIAQANASFKAQAALGEHSFANRVAAAAVAVEEIFSSGGSRGLLHRYRHLFGALNGGH